MPLVRRPHPTVATVSGSTWVDKNADGIQDASETAYGDGAMVELLQGGKVVAATTTDANGQYAFEDLVPGTYEVGVVPPPGYLSSPQDQGSNDAIDSDVNPRTRQSAPFALSSGQTFAGPNAGLFQRVCHRLFESDIHAGSKPSFFEGGTLTGGGGGRGGWRVFSFPVWLAGFAPSPRGRGVRTHLAPNIKIWGRVHRFRLLAGWILAGGEGTPQPAAGGSLASAGFESFHGWLVFFFGPGGTNPPPLWGAGVGKKEGLIGRGALCFPFLRKAWNAPGLV
jgi:hypothetical protein